MKFKDFPYERPDFEVFKATLSHMIQEFKNATTSTLQIEKAKEIHRYVNTVMTEADIASVRYTINTKDDFYEKESDYWDEYIPMYAEVINTFEAAMLDSPFRSDLEKEFSKQYFDIMENTRLTFSPEIIEEMKQENKLVTEYNKLIASAEIEFEGKTYNLAGLRPFMLSKDRAIRKRANEAYFSFFEAHENQIDELFDKLVQIRDQKAKKLGFKDYVEFGYRMMNRNDYNRDMVANYRKQVLEDIVPVANELYARQAKRLGLGHLAYYDVDFEFNSGNATPQGDATFILENGRKMYSELSPETKEFFEFMTENQLLDLETKPGKQSGGYCIFFPAYKSPFIFSNFNGTSGDIEVLTHEAGHAFQVYQSRWIDVPGLTFPTFESCEIHSMSMEFITWPWMENFFKQDTAKYKYEHLGSAIKFIPYGIIVDAFQHFVYENPKATPTERKAYWRELERQYLPHKDYSECALLERGTWWYKQGHIFASPFYYIDYTLAQVCALQFWEKMNHDRKTGWEDYMRICKPGGTKSFLQLVELANLKSPFEEGCIKEIIKGARNYLMSIDDTNL